jgi:hypothetical protein
MATSDDGGTLARAERALLWGAWVELGVSGWQRTHADWAIDPEPLVIATAAIEDADPRLRDEALDWCVHNWRYVSRVRLRNLLHDAASRVQEAWGPFAATVSEHSGATWPEATESFAYRTTGRSVLDSMDRPSRAWLRLRGMFGLGARTEILRYFLSGHRRATTATIATHIGYTKRVVADECDALTKAGVLRSQQSANRFYYGLDRGAALRAFVGDIAPVRPDWSALFRVTSAFVRLEAAAERVPAKALVVEARKVVDQIDDDLDDLDIEDRPTLIQSDTYWPAVRDFADRYLSAWANGIWDAEEEHEVSLVVPSRPVRRRVPPTTGNRARP